MGLVERTFGCHSPGSQTSRIRVAICTLTWPQSPAPEAASWSPACAGHQFFFWPTKLYLLCVTVTQAGPPEQGRASLSLALPVSLSDEPESLAA